MALIVGAGCSRAEQPAPASATPTASAPTATPAASNSSGAATGTDFDWIQRVGAPAYFQLPKDPRGDWVPRGMLGESALLMSLIPRESASAADRGSFASELASFDTGSGTVRPLVRQAPGRQAVQPIVAGTSMAWIEVAAGDLRGFGWTLHLTDTRTGADRVVASDSGFHPEGVSVVPSIAYHDNQLLYTRPAEGQTEPQWELHRLQDQTDETVATLPRIRDQRFLSIAVDGQAITWTENVTNPDPHTKVGIYDLASRKIVTRARVALSSVYQIARTPTNLYFGTGFGVFESDRTVSYEPRRFTPEAAAVDQIAVVGNYLVYRNFDAAQTVAALDLTSRAHARLGSNATFGPVPYQRSASWFERASSTTPARIVIIKA